MKILNTFILLIAVFGFMFTACDSVLDPNYVHSTNHQAEEDFSFVIASEDIAKLDLYSINGTVNIVGSATEENIVVTGTKIVKSESQRDAVNYLHELHVSFAQQGTTMFVESEQPADTDGREVIFNYLITIPQHFSTTIELLNGVCDLDSLHGSIYAKLTNGDILLDQIHAHVNANVTNGQVQGNVTLPANGTLYARTTNGQVQLAVPQDVSAELSAQVVNGSVSVTGLSIQNMNGTNKHITGTLGDGSGIIDLKTTNGNISLSSF